MFNTQRGSSVWKCHCRAQAVTCHCATIDGSHSLALSPALMQNWILSEQTASLDAMQLCVHREAVHPALYTDTELPTFNKSYFLLFTVQIPSLALFFKIFFAAYLWLWTSLLRFWSNVADPPQLQACLKITASHQVWFGVGKRNVALSWRGCQDRILLMYAVITWISVLGQGWI